MKIIPFIKNWLRTTPLYIKLRRYGAINTFRRLFYRQRTGLLATLRLSPQRTRTSCEIHLLTSAWDWDLALWAVGSFYHFSRVDWPLVVHDGGGMRPEWFARFEKLFPGCRVVPSKVADDLVNTRLQSLRLPATLHARANYNLMRKVIDTAVLCQAPRYVLLDSDVLFFQQPRHLLDLVDEKDDRIHLLRDYQDSYSIDPDTAVNQLGIPLPPLVNTGLALIPRVSIELPAMEEMFARQVIPLDRDGFAEQTVLALLAQRHGFDYLPNDHSVVTCRLGNRESPGVCRHYVGPVKKLFFDEGVPRFIQSMRS